MSLRERLRIHDVSTLAEDWSVLKKTRLSFRRRDGTWQEQWRETYDRGDGAVILLYNRARRTVLLTRQFRYPAYVNGHDDLMIEAPAGLLDSAAPEARIRAEVAEEAGVLVGPVELLMDVFMSPGSVTERLHFFIGSYEQEDRIGPGGGCAEEGEDIGVIEMTIDAALNAVRTGHIRDGKTIILLQHAALHIFR
jgi:nudix-type nucleoside diphosphatase (YffH/AdpP family)